MRDTWFPEAAVVVTACLKRLDDTHGGDQIADFMEIRSRLAAGIRLQEFSVAPDLCMAETYEP